MTDLARPRIVFLGLPQSGKSTFLGAFWALIQSPVETSVRETSFGGDRSYVQKLADQVARAEELDRTALDSAEELSVEVGFDAEGVADLLIPDVSGESLRVLVERRIWYPRLLAACADATAILIFVHPERLRLPERLVGAPGGESAAEPTEVTASTESSTDAVEPYPAAVDHHRPAVREFGARQHACTAAELIDVFENIAELWSGRGPIRVGVIVSAWDGAAAEPGPTPYEWLAKRLPGLLATLESNRDVTEFAVFGVSAQGGPLAARDQLLAKGEIADRVFAEDRSGRRVSLAEPIRWAIWGS